MNKDNKLKLLFDADMLAFAACSSIETEINWGDGLWTLHAEEQEAKDIIDDKVERITTRVLDILNYDGEYEIIMCFSDVINFRKVLYPTYKANRIGKRKPVCYKGIVDWMKDEFTTYSHPGLEADDCLGILATCHTNTVIISGDKDFKSIPGRFFDYLHREFHEISVEEADRAHLFQTLIGDTADNYPGCPGIGEKTAEKLFDTSGATWATVVSAFAKKGLTEEDALVQARVARILRRTDFDADAGVPILWTPPA